jgi:membrane protein DedA with SNARE-associated domain
MSIGQLIASFGYLAVFVLVGIESLGIPLPGETALITAAIVAGQTHRLSPWLIFLVASAGAIIGDNIGYWIGDKGGYRLVRHIEQRGIPIWFGRRRRVHPVDEQNLKIARYLFDRHGSKVVFLGRFVSVLRTYAAFLAGVNRMHWRRFFVANAAGGIIWAAFYTFGAYLAGAALQRASGTITLVTGIVAAVLIVAGVIAFRRRKGVLAERAEHAYPEQLPEQAEAAVGHHVREMDPRCK